MAKIIFEKIENEDIFVSDYKKLIRNNEIDFSREGISVIYGPNGTGKTSLVKVLSSHHANLTSLMAFHDTYQRLHTDTYT